MNYRELDDLHDLLAHIGQPLITEPEGSAGRVAFTRLAALCVKIRYKARAQARADEVELRRETESDVRF